MSANKVEMSLDEIIKANKRKDNAGQRTSGKKGGAAGRSGVTKRKPGFAAKKNSSGVQKRGRPVQGRKNINNNTSRNGNNNRFKKNVPRNIKGANKRNTSAAANTIATKRLVQNLVKKALAQRNVGVRSRVSAATPTAIRRRGGVRLVKKTVVLNRVSPRSRVIAPRRRVVPVTTLKPQRAQIRYNTVPQTVQIVSPAPVRRNYVPARQRKFVNRRPVVVQQQARPAAYQLVQVPLGGRAGGSVRQQINAMRRGTVYVTPQQQQRRPQQQHQQQFRQRPRRQQQQRQQQVTYVEQQPRRRFQNRRRQQQQSFSPFYEPPSFLQRIPVSQPTVVRRFQ